MFCHGVIGIVVVVVIVGEISYDIGGKFYLRFGTEVEDAVGENVYVGGEGVFAEAEEDVHSREI